MGDGLAHMLESTGFMPHGHCFLWAPWLLGLMVASDTVIALAYYSIPLALLSFVRRRRDVRFGWIFVMFSVFIFACGTTHVMSIWTIWHPDYWLEGGIKLVTAAASISTALLLWPLLPRALKIPTTEQLERTVARLEQEIRIRRGAEADLDEMNRTLEQRIELRTIELEQAVAERERLRDAERARAAAEQANHAKTEFISRVSHELRTPLNAILGFAQLLKRTTVQLDSKQNEWVDRIETAGWHLVEMIRDLLDISRIEAGHLDMSVREVAIQPLLHECEDMLRSLAEEHGIALRIEFGTPGAPVQADPTRLKQVLSNLLSNAIKYNRPGGQAILRVSHEVEPNSCVRFDIEDNGLGLTAEQQAGLFQPFNRLGRERDGIAGVGIGLALARQLVEAMGGEIGVRSEAGTGSTFTVRLPAAQPA